MISTRKMLHFVVGFIFILASEAQLKHMRAHGVDPAAKPDNAEWDAAFAALQVVSYHHLKEVRSELQ